MITKPAFQSAPIALTPVSKSDSRKSMDPMPQLKVLYLDDEPDICDVFSELYSNEKVSVRTFTQPTMAIEFAKSNPPDIIFLDYRLPSTNGDLVALAMDSRIPKCLISGDIM